MAKGSKKAETLVKDNPTAPIDYKKLSEKQASDIAALKARNSTFEERLNALENGSNDQKPPVESIRKDLEVKANTLGISFRSNIGDAKLLTKIQEIEPEFKIESNE